MSVYSLIKPPKYGNCTVSENYLHNVIKVEDLKQIYKESKRNKMSRLVDLKTKLDDLIMNEDWEVDQVIEQNPETCLDSILDSIIYYVTGS